MWFQSMTAIDITTIGRARPAQGSGAEAVACQAWRMGNLVADLRAITGPAHVVTDPDVVAGYATDWTRRYSGAAACVVSPGSTAQVAEAVQACAGYGARVIPQGGNTG